MSRTEHYNDPDTPAPNTLIPASNLLVVVDDDGRIPLQKRRDTGQ